MNSKKILWARVTFNGRAANSGTPSCTPRNPSPQSRRFVLHRPCLPFPFWSGPSLVSSLYLPYPLARSPRESLSTSDFQSEVGEVFGRNWWRTSGEVWKEIFELLLLGKIVRSIFHQNSTANFTIKLHYEVLGCGGPYIVPWLRSPLY